MKILRSLDSWPRVERPSVFMGSRPGVPGGLRLSLRPWTISGRRLPLSILRRAQAVAQTTHITNQYATLIHRESAVLFLMPPAPRLDPSRPSAAARALMRIVTRESSMRMLQPFYSTLVRRVLREEQYHYRTRPAKAIGLIWSLFGSKNAFQTLTRFYLSAVSRMGTGFFPALDSANTMQLAAGLLLYGTTARRYTVRETLSDAVYRHRPPPATGDALARSARSILEEERERAGAPPANASGDLHAEARFTERELRLVTRSVWMEVERRLRAEGTRRGRGAPF